VQLSAERRKVIEDGVRQHIATAKGLIHTEIERQQIRSQKLERERKKLLQAHYDDAIAPDLFKSEQHRITSAITSAQSILKTCEMQFDEIEQTLDQLLALATNAKALYAAGAPRERRYMNQAVFEKLWIINDEIAGVDLQSPYAQVLAQDLSVRLESEESSLIDGTYGERITGTRTDSAIDDDEPVIARQLSKALLTDIPVSTAFVPYWGETTKRKRDKELRLERVGTWEDAARSLKEGGNTIYFRSQKDKSIPNWLSDPLMRPFGPLPQETANPEATSVARGSNVVLLVGDTGLEPVTPAV
jgi:hypothetical protein